jgi:RNA polymerase-binding transcription factor DksA
MVTSGKMKKRIEDELQSVNREIEALKKEPRAQELEGFGDNTPLSEDVDALVATENTELAIDRLGRLLDRAAALDEALHRINERTYGACVACGGKISSKRLMAVPEALRCMRCQEEAERLHHREIHAHEWKRAEETFRERRQSEEGEPTALFGTTRTPEE